MFEPDLSRLKVCFLAGTLGQGGAERQLFYMAKALKENGGRPRVLSLTRGELWEARLREIDVPVTWVGQHSFQPRRLARIVQEVRNDRPHILHSGHFFTNLYAAAAARLSSAREVGSIRSDVRYEFLNNGRLLGTLGMKLPGVLAANSPAAIRTATKMGIRSERLYFLPNAIETERFHPVERSDAEPIVILAVGRLGPEKRYDRLLNVVAGLRSRTAKQFRLVIVGSGRLRPELEALAKELGLHPDVVEFHGPAADPALLYQRADIFLHTPDYEGTPNVVLEAMACGLPVVATEVGGIPDIVNRDLNGFLAGVSEPQLLVDGLVQLIENRELRRRMGTHARSFVMQHHSMSRLPAVLKNLYGLALSRGRRTPMNAYGNGSLVH